MNNKSIWHKKGELSQQYGKCKEYGQVILHIKRGNDETYELYHGNYGVNGRYFEHTIRWCYLSDLLSCEQKLQKVRDYIESCIIILDIRKKEFKTK